MSVCVRVCVCFKAAPETVITEGSRWLVTQPRRHHIYAAAGDLVNTRTNLVNLVKVAQ